LSGSPEGNRDVPPHHFLALPAELRLRIYEYVFNHERACFITFAGAQSNIHWVRNPALSQLLRTCRTVYREAQPTLFSETVLDLYFGRLGWKLNRPSEVERSGTLTALTTDADFRFLRHIKSVRIKGECLTEKFKSRMVPALCILVDAMKESAIERHLTLWGPNIRVVRPRDVADMLRTLPSSWRIDWQAPHYQSLGGCCDGACAQSA